MLVPDVNVFVDAHRPDSPRHREHRAWLTEALDGIEPVGISDLVLAGFLRIVTNHRVYRQPTPALDALDYCEIVRRAPASVPVRPDARHWPISADLCRQLGARANVVPDAYDAALAIEHGATWITTDRGFGRFPGLRWATPLDG